MGLCLSVGNLADARNDDSDVSSRAHADFARLNEAIVSTGLKPHHEPCDLGESLRFSCDMWGYSGLHHLRRIAAHDAFGNALPAPVAEHAADDPVLARYYASSAQAPGLLSRLFGSGRGSRLRYQHLIVHSDAEGYYLPQDFSRVVYTTENLQIPGGVSGSVPRLLEECLALAKLLEIPDGLGVESDDLLVAAERSAFGSKKWQRYGIESFSCVRLLAACEASLKSGAAIVFC